MFDSKTIPRVFKVPVGVDFSRVFLDGLKSRLHEKEPHELAQGQKTVPEPQPVSHSHTVRDSESN